MAKLESVMAKYVDRSDGPRSPGIHRIHKGTLPGQKPSDHPGPTPLITARLTQCRIQRNQRSNRLSAAYIAMITTINLVSTESVWHSLPGLHVVGEVGQILVVRQPAPAGACMQAIRVSVSRCEREDGVDQDDF
jgi:hypothetical protein